MMSAHRVTAETLPEARARHERELAELVRQALDAAGWIQSDAARLLGASVTALRRIASRDRALARDLRDRSKGPGRRKMQQNG